MRRRIISTGLVTVFLTAAGVFALFVGLNPGLMNEGNANTCGVSYRSTSYGAGVGVGLGKGDLTPVLNDPVCFEFGKKRGAMIAAEFTEEPAASECAQLFDEARGNALDGDWSQGGHPCRVAGQLYGRAQLEAYARELKEDLLGTHGPQCVETYQTARERGARDLGQDIASDLPRQVQECYKIGHHDGAFFR